MRNRKRRGSARTRRHPREAWCHHVRRHMVCRFASPPTAARFTRSATEERRLMNAKTVAAAVVGVVVGVLVGTSWDDTRHSADEAAIRALLAEQDAAWNRGDLDG